LRAERKLIVDHRQRLNDMMARTRQTLRLQVQRRQDRLDHAGQLLTSLSYQGVLARGYVLVLDEAGQPLNSAAQVRPAAGYRLRFADGEAQVVGKATS